MNIPHIEDLDSPKKKGTLYIKKHYPEFHQYILEHYPYINKFNAGIYLYFRNMDHPTCPICGKPTPFLDETRGFQRCCSSKCANSDPEFRKKITKTCLQKYGTKTPAESTKIKEKVIKTYTERHGGMGNAADRVRKKHHQTMIELYGTEHALQNDTIMARAKETHIMHNGGIGMAGTCRSKIEQTNLERYGTEHVLGSPAIRSKIERTNLERYGTEHVSKNRDVRNAISRTKISSRIKGDPDILDIEIIDGYSVYTMRCPHAHCNKCKTKTYKIPASVLYDRKRDRNELCTHILPVQRGRNQNTSLEIFIKDILKGAGIIVPTKHEDRQILGGRGLDFYLPSYKLAIECNGIYWHSTRKKDDPKYHYQKFADCQQQGIQLLTIWQDWIFHKPDIVKSILLSKLGKTQRIWARNCTIEIVNANIAREFYNENHIQGYTHAKYHIALYERKKYIDNCVKLNLVAMMSFDRRKSGQGSKNDNSWELVRYCSVLNTTVVGGASKLLKCFITKENPDQIVSFSSNDISNGNLYRRLGFVFDRINRSYWYIDKQYNRFHRSTFTRASLLARGWVENPDSDWTEYSVMNKCGFFRIWDCGQTKWILKIKKEER